LHAARSTATRSIPSRCHLPKCMLSASLIACRCRPATRSSSAATRCTRACPSRRAHGTSSRVSSEGGRCRSPSSWSRSHQLTASLVRYVLTGFVDFRAAVEAVRPFYGPIPGALPTPELHAECLPLFTGTLPTLRLERAACMQVLSMAPAPLSSQARCPLRLERAACMQVLSTAPVPHPSLHRHAAHSVWSGQQRLPLATPRHEPRAPLPRLWWRPR